MAYRNPLSMESFERRDMPAGILVPRYDIDFAGTERDETREAIMDTLRRHADHSPVPIGMTAPAARADAHADSSDDVPDDLVADESDVTLHGVTVG